MAVKGYRSKSEKLNLVKNGFTSRNIFVRTEYGIPYRKPKGTE